MDDRSSPAASTDGHVSVLPDLTTITITDLLNLDSPTLAAAIQRLQAQSADPNDRSAGFQSTI